MTEPQPPPEPEVDAMAQLRAASRMSSDVLITVGKLEVAIAELRGESRSQHTELKGELARLDRHLARLNGTVATNQTRITAVEGQQLATAAKDRELEAYRQGAATALITWRQWRSIIGILLSISVVAGGVGAVVGVFGGGWW